MTDDEIKQKLISSFDLWKIQVMRLIKQAATYVKHVLNTDRINGYSLEELLAIIRGEVNDHEKKADNPHQDKLDVLGGIVKAEFDTMTVTLFPKDAVPVSDVPQIVASISGSAVVLPSTAIIYQGRKLTVPGVSLTLATAARQYVKINITNPGQRATAQFVASTSQDETITSMIVGYVDYDSVRYTATMLRTVRIGNATLRNNPRGQSIPTSTGSQSTSGSISADWIK